MGIISLQKQMKKFFTTMACFSAATAVRTASLQNSIPNTEC